MPKTPRNPDDELGHSEAAATDLPGEETIIQHIGSAPGTPGAVDERRAASRASVTQRILFAENVGEYLVQLRAYRTSGNYRDGAQYGDELYGFVVENFVDDPASSERELLLMRIINEAGWMQYSIIEEGAETQFQTWSDRAQEVYKCLNEKRKKFEEAGVSNLELRRELIVGEMKMKICEVRLNWKLGQFFEKDEVQYKTCGDALFQANLMLNQDRLFRELDSSAGDLQRQVVNILNADPEYGAAVAEAKRMIAVISDLTYAWHQDYQMRDHDAAEKTLPEDPKHAALLKDAEAKLMEYTVFYRDHSEIPQPPELRYAYLERIRQFKLIGKYDEALRLALRVKKQIEGKSDALYRSRILNRIGEGQIVLAQKILQAQPGTREYEDLARQAEVVDFELDAKSPRPGISPSLRAFKFLNQGRTVCLEAMKVPDVPTARIARDSACDGALTLLTMHIGLLGRTAQQKLVQETWASFRALPWKFDDGTWFFSEAPALAKLCEVTRKLGIDINIFEEVPREHFEAAHRELALEYRKSKPNVPRTYYEIVAEKIKMLRWLLML